MESKDRWKLQQRVTIWVRRCFGTECLMDRRERGARVLEEAAELAQALGCPKDQVIRTIDHVYSRPVGDPAQEIGGVATTLLAACSALEEDFEILAEREVSRIESKDPEYFRERNAAKADAGIGSYKR